MSIEEGNAELNDLEQIHITAHCLVVIGCFGGEIADGPSTTQTAVCKQKKRSNKAMIILEEEDYKQIKS